MWVMTRATPWEPASEDGQALKGRYNIGNGTCPALTGLAATHHHLPRALPSLYYTSPKPFGCGAALWSAVAEPQRGDDTALA